MSKHGPKQQDVRDGMNVEEDLLERHRRFDKPDAGLSEEFIQPVLAGSRTVAVITRPLGPSLPAGWVACHAFGIEQIHQSRLDVTAARSLASVGFTVIRFHGKGYGDNEAGMEETGPDSHIEEAMSAVELLRQQAGIVQVGTMGSRFGGTVAALVAERMELPLMALWEPILNGRAYARDLLRSETIADLMSNTEARHSSVKDIRELLETQGWADIKGFRLSRRAYEAMVGLNLLDELRTFRGSSLVISLSRGAKPGSALIALADQLRQLGGSSVLQVVEDPFASQFGQFRWRAVEGGRSKTDTRFELDRKIASATVDWAVRQVQASPDAMEGRR